MNRDDIIRMAMEAGDDWDHTLPEDREFLERFAALVAAAQRKECAKVCEEHWRNGGNAMECADSIRARSEE